MTSHRSTAVHIPRDFSILVQMFSPQHWRRQWQLLIVQSSYLLLIDSNIYIYFYEIGCSRCVSIVGSRIYGRVRRDCGWMMEWCRGFFDLNGFAAPHVHCDIVTNESFTISYHRNKQLLQSCLNHEPRWTKLGEGEKELAQRRSNGRRLRQL